MISSAHYDPEKNVTSIFAIGKGRIELEGNHMDSEELDEYTGRDFNNE